MDVGAYTLLHLSIMDLSVLSRSLITVLDHQLDAVLELFSDLNRRPPPVEVIK